MTAEEALDYARYLASGQALSIHLTNEEGIWSVELVREASVVWSDQGLDKKILCFNVIGWLQRDVEILHPEWIRKGPELCHRVASPNLFEKDPPDLDPKEIAEVYGVVVPKR